MKKVTMADVAQVANVSKSTVSQYLNKRYDYMGEKTRQRIGEAITTLGYQANHVARSLKQKRTSTIGVIVANILHAFSTQVIRSIEDLCHEKDISVIVCNADDDPKKEKNYIDILRAKQVDGLIVFPTGGNLELYEGMVKEDYPLIFLDRKVEGLNVDTLLLDNEDAVKLAVSHLVEQGHERMGIITPSLLRNVTSRVERIDGFKKALKAHGIQPQDHYIKGLEVDEIKQGLAEMLSLDEPPTAILAGNDLSLMEILTFVSENQIEIPRDLALIGIDDVSFAHMYSPPLTTISQPAFEIGKTAAELLLDKITQSDIKKAPKTHRFKGHLNVRHSS